MAKWALKKAGPALEFYAREYEGLPRQTPYREQAKTFDSVTEAVDYKIKQGLRDFHAFPLV